MTLLLLQLLLPLALIAWLLARPAEDALGRVAQVSALTTVVGALAISGLWLFPPWWSVWVYGVAAGLAALSVGLGKSRRLTPRGWGWIRLLGLTLLTIYAGREAYLGYQGRRPPATPAVALQFPLAEGSYLVVNGGTDRRVSSHMLTLDPSFRGHRDYRGQSYGVDIVGLNRWGGTSSGVFPRDPTAWAIYGAPVLAPCDGRVKASGDGVPDTPVPIPDRRQMTGNFVLLTCGEFEVLLAHLAPGSVAVSQGQAVKAGRRLGRVGNTGNTNTPHLHIHAQRPSATAALIAGEPLPMTFGGRFLVRNDRPRGSAD